MESIRKTLRFILLVLLKICVGIVNGRCFKQERGSC